MSETLSLTQQPSTGPPQEEVVCSKDGCTNPHAIKKPTKRRQIILYALCDGCCQKNNESAARGQANTKQKTSHNTPSASSKISRIGNLHPEATLARVQIQTLLWEIGMCPPDTLHTRLSAYLGYPSNPTVKIGELDNNSTWLHKLWALMPSSAKPQEQRELKDVLGEFLTAEGKKKGKKFEVQGESGASDFVKVTPTNYWKL
jgi:hypothetical protein